MVGEDKGESINPMEVSIWIRVNVSVNYTTKLLQMQLNTRENASYDGGITPTACNYVMQCVCL